MLARTKSCAVIGVEGFLIDVEVNAPDSGDMTFVSIVGLPDAAVKESRDRIKSALHSSGLPHPKGNTIVNLAPADIKKEGASFDLAIAIGILAASKQVKRDKIDQIAFLGELALDGSIRPVRGALPAGAIMKQKNSGVTALVVPESNAMEAAIAAGDLPVYGIKHLTDAVNFLNDPDSFIPIRANMSDITLQTSGYMPDFGEVKGQAMARRAMEIAAAGGHNSLMIGPPGTGKSMLASRLNTILPPMTLDETLETSRIYSVLGLLNGKPIINTRPYRAPHHTISDIALIGGGREPRPGEISLSHNGVLFLDELPEFKRNVLEVLRQPLENGFIAVSRAAGSCVFPARFMLVGAMNPCPCGRGDAELGCTCKVEEKRRYRRKVSGPLLDRIDLHVAVKNLTQEELLSAPDGECSAVIRSRVLIARETQNARFNNTKTYCNAQMTSRDLVRYCNINASSQALLRQAITRFNLSPRAYDRILKVARTIADLARSEEISNLHVLEAINYRAQSVEQFQ